jgi:hypothetical protein
MKPETHKLNVYIPFLQLTFGTIIIFLLAACASPPPVRQQDLHAWVGISVEALDAHTFFKTMPMFRTRTASGTEIRNYAYGYDFGECFGKEGASQFGDFVNENAFITCSSSRIVCNNIFYIKEDKILEYAPTGRCDTDERVQVEAHNLVPKTQ